MARILSKVDSEVKKIFQKAVNIFFFIGAGVSVESGVPSFRGLGQMDYFEDYFPMYLCSQEAFQRHTQLCWRFFKHIHDISTKAEPNIAHKTITKLQQEAKNLAKNITVLTLSYDGLLNKAGVEDVLELHGNINYAICLKCNKKRDLAEINLADNPIPICSCTGLLKPNVILLDESVEESIYDQATIAARNSDLYFVIGSSGVHQHSKYFLMNTPEKCITIEINPMPSYLSRHCDYVLRAKAEEILPQLKS